MKNIKLRTGTIEYQDIGAGPVVVFVHGFLVDSQIWQPVIQTLSADHRCIAPNWPLGSHRIAQRKDADLGVHSIAQLIGEFLDALDLHDVTLVGNDSGGAISQLVVADHGVRVGRVVLTNCDALDVFPPSGFGYIKWVGKVPGATWLMAKTMRALPFLMRWKYAYGGVTKRPIDREQLMQWTQPIAIDRGVRRDSIKFGNSISNRVTLDVAERLPSCDKPAALLWGEDDRFFHRQLAIKLASCFADAEMHFISDAKTFVMLDQPLAVADGIRAFVAKRSSRARPVAAA